MVSPPFEEDTRRRSPPRWTLRCPFRGHISLAVEGRHLGMSAQVAGLASRRATPDVWIVLSQRRQALASRKRVIAMELMWAAARPCAPATRCGMTAGDADPALAAFRGCARLRQSPPRDPNAQRHPDPVRLPPPRRRRPRPRARR